MILETELQLRFLETGQREEFMDGWEHCKTVPYTIVAQVLFGRYELICPRGRVLIEPGEAFLTGADLPLQIIHHGALDRDGRMGSRWVHFHLTCFETVDATSLLEMPLRLNREQAEPFGTIIGELRAMDSTPVHSPLAYAACRQELGFRILTLLAQLCPMSDSADHLLKGIGRLQPVLRHIRAHAAELLCVSDLARIAHLSAPRIHALFRELLGKGPMEYVRHVRLNEARHRLGSTEMTIAQIAELTGFQNPYHFTRVFKQAFGIAPSEYRKRRREER